MEQDWKGTVCVVTGGAGGIGRCLAETFAARGCAVAVMDQNRPLGEDLARRLGGECLFFCGDVGRQEDLEAFAGEVVRRWGAVDFLLNNACLTRRGILSGCSWDDFNYVLRVGASAAYELCRLFRPYFQQGASVVNITSTRDRMSQRDTESYTAAKGAISALTRALAVSLGPAVRVNAIAPGWVDTGGWHGDEGYRPDYADADLQQHPSGRVGRPEDIARAALFLCDGANSFITGQELTVDGGMTARMIYHGDEGWTLKGER